MNKTLFTIFVLLNCYTTVFSQTITQTVKGNVFDKITQEPLVGATIVLQNSTPAIATTTDAEGNYFLENIPVGRQVFEISMIGYESYIENEILVSSGKQIILNIGLQEEVFQLGELVLTARKNKNSSNTMATVSSRKFTIEESQRFAGGLNDPARLVSSFAGVASPSISNNGISIRGNAPSGLLWRIEGVEVPSPNHFANLTIAGAGLLTAISNQVMDNSDFYTGAFPAEYGNATSGVFDINLKKGNTSKREYAIQAGLLGVDFATEGPFKKGKEASYLFNYRYSTLALIGSLLPDNSGVLRYQDLSYTVNMPTERFGDFSLWSIVALDGVDIDALGSSEWESVTDKDNSQTSMYMFATGINHKISLKSDATVKTSFSVTGNGLTHHEQRLNDSLEPHPQSNASNNGIKYTLQSSITKRFGDMHTNRTGFYLNHLRYNLDVEESLSNGASPSSLVNERGHSNLLQFYSESKLRLTSQFTVNAGFHIQYFKLNNNVSIEPRLALKYKLNRNNSIALAYGLHSKIESLPIYFVEYEGNQPNKDLEFMKSNHFVFSYNAMLSDNLRLSIEPYYQYLTHVPVSPYNYISTLNINDNLFFNHTLVSSGTARNIGVDFTLERYLNKGLYYMVTASVFDSKYKDNNGVERNTRFNKNYVFNALVGKEWSLGKNNNKFLNANIRLNYLGGSRIEAIDIESSANQQDIVYGETNGNLSFNDKYPDIPVVSFSVSYTKNKPNHSSVWSLQILNATQAKDFEKNIYNIQTNQIEQRFDQIMVPNLSYKIEF